MKTIIVIQARMASNRLPGKAISPICGKAALDHLIDRTLMTGLPTIVATTNDPRDHPIRAIAKNRKLTGYTLPGNDMSDSVPKRLLSASNAFRADHVVRVTGDDILVEPSYIERAIDEHIESGASFTRIPDLPRGFDCEVISRKALFVLTNEFTEDELIGDVLGDPNWFIVHNVETEKRHRRPDINLELNTSDDLVRIRSVFSALHKSYESPFGLDDVLAVEDELDGALMESAA